MHLLFAAAVPTIALTAPLALTPTITRMHRPPPRMAQDWRDSPEFLNNPIGFISKYPQLFSEDLQVMASYQLKIQGDQIVDWGDLPDALDLCAKNAAYFRQKSTDADQIARIIVQADSEELQTFAQDAKFMEKKAFFQALAALPPGNNGMSAIHEVASSMLEAGALAAW